MKKLLFTVFVRGAAALGLYDVLAQFSKRFVSEYDGETFGPLKPRQDNNKITVLFFDADKFRGEIEIFSKAPDIRILSISWAFLGKLADSFVQVPDDVLFDKNNVPVFSKAEKYLLNDEQSGIAHARKIYRAFCEKLIAVLYPLLGVDVTMNSNCRYYNDVEFVYAGEAIGYPHICFYREALHMAPSEYYRAMKRLMRYDRYPGSYMAVQNEITRQLFIESGIIDEEKIIIRGSVRMDDFIKNIDTYTKPPRESVHKQITFFSAPEEIPYYDDYSDYHLHDRREKKNFSFWDISEITAKALCEMAIQDPGLCVVFKLKDNHMDGPERGQLGKLKAIVEDVVGGDQIPENVVFETRKMAAQDVIASSDIVCGVQSTTLLEAAIMGKPVILLHYDSLKMTEGSQQCLIYKDYEDLFDVPKDIKAFKAMIENVLEDPSIEEKLMDKRRAAFEELVSFMDASAGEKSLALIRQAAEAKR